jgi:transcriptional regulator with XRE-family HTH domain
MPKIAQALAENLKKLRKDKGLKQEELANMVGVTRQTIGVYEKAEGHVGVATIEKLAEVLGVEETDLVAVSKPAEKVEMPKEQWAEIRRALVGPHKGLSPEIAKIVKTLEEHPDAIDAARAALSAYMEPEAMVADRDE